MEFTREYKTEETMLKLEDYEVEEEEIVPVADEVSDDEGELRCSDFDVPLFTWETFIDLILMHVNKITQEQWDLLAFDKIDRATVFVLTELCNDIIESVTMEVLDEIEPQYIAANTPVTTNNAEAPQRERNLCAVTGEDIEASLGDSLNQCFAEVMAVTDKKSVYSEQLRELIAGEVARKVNSRLSAQSTSPKEMEEFMEIETPLTIEMVKNISKIFSQNLLRKNSSETSEDELESASSYQYEDCEIISFSSEYSDPPSSLVCTKNSGPSSSLVCTKNSSPQSALDSFEYSNSPNSVVSSEYSNIPSSLLAMPSSIQKKFPKGEKSFLTMLLAKVLDQITESTKTSILALDFDGILNNIIELVEEQSFPPTCGTLHLSMYDNLCKEFKNPKILQGAIMSDDPAFAEAFSKELKTQLEKARKPPSFFTKLKNFFKRKSNKVAPVVRTI